MRQATSKAVAGSSANRRQVLSLAAGIALLAGVTTAHAQSTGIVPCDDFLTKYDACIVSKVPEAQRAMYKTQIDQTRKAWVDMAKNPSTKATMEATCKQTLDATKASLTALWLHVLTGACAAEKEWRRAPFLDGERGEAGGAADDNGEALFRNFGRNDVCSAGARFHDQAARLQGAVCKPSLYSD